jgi:hypothetical protein
VRTLVTIAVLGPLMVACSFNGSTTYDPSGFGPLADADPGAQVDATEGALVDANPGAPDAEVMHSYLSYWSFNVDSTDLMGAHDGVLAGGAAITGGSQGFAGGEALVLSAEGDRVDLGNPTTFDFNSDFTWHLYIKTSDSSGALLSRNPLASQWNQGSKALFVRNSKIQWDTGWVSNPDTGTVVNDDQWHQIIATYAAQSDTLNIFVDPSVGDTSGDFSGSHDVDAYDEHTHNHNGGLAETSFAMGQANFTSGLASLDTLIGLIDEVAVFDRVLSGAELDQLITSGPQSF